MASLRPLLEGDVVIPAVVIDVIEDVGSPHIPLSGSCFILAGTDFQQAVN
jgi:hypothetical protein